MTAACRPRLSRETERVSGNVKIRPETGYARRGKSVGVGARNMTGWPIGESVLCPNTIRDDEWSSRVLHIDEIVSLTG